MTRKDYIKFARAIRNAAEINEDHENGQLAKDALVAIASDIADIFAADNPRFDYVRFLEACGL